MYYTTVVFYTYIFAKSADRTVIEQRGEERRSCCWKGWQLGGRNASPQGIKKGMEGSRSSWECGRFPNIWMPYIKNFMLHCHIVWAKYVYQLQQKKRGVGRRPKVAEILLKHDLPNRSSATFHTRFGRSMCENLRACMRLVCLSHASARHTHTKHTHRSLSLFLTQRSQNRFVTCSLTVAPLVAGV